MEREGAAEGRHGMRPRRTRGCGREARGARPRRRAGRAARGAGAQGQGRAPGVGERRKKREGREREEGAHHGDPNSGDQCLQILGHHREEREVGERGSARDN
jgi:hypothetical protein